MSTREFCQHELRGTIAPPSFGSVKARINKAARTLHWSVSRTKDIWYAEPRASISGDELRRIEQVTGHFYAAKDELNANDEITRKIEAILGDTTFRSALVAALREALGLENSPGTGRGD